MATAILIDGGFFLQRYRRLRGPSPPDKTARDLHWMCLQHLKRDQGKQRRLYRIFFYDCPPLAKKVHNPVSGLAIDFAKTPTDEISQDDVKYEVRQKGVDMRIGLDIASMAYKRQVDQLILVAGDSDFVPAAKLARREGIDFILDPMWAKIRDDLHEHIDGLRSVFNQKLHEHEQKPGIDDHPSTTPTA
jgi:uncharacterized LabA/DUF88 family protein